MFENELQNLVSKLAEIDTCDAQSIAAILNCEFTRTRYDRYLASNLPQPFSCADLRVDRGRGILILSLDQPVDATNENAVPKKLGPPIDIQIVSPPIFDPEEPAARPPWDSKYSYCYLFHSRKVWFGFEKFGAAEKLTSITIHYD